MTQRIKVFVTPAEWLIIQFQEPKKYGETQPNKVVFSSPHGWHGIDIHPHYNVNEI